MESAQYLLSSHHIRNILHLITFILHRLDPVALLLQLLDCLPYRSPGDTKMLTELLARDIFLRLSQDL